MPSSVIVAPRGAPAGGPVSGSPGRLKNLLSSPTVFLFVILTAQLMVVLDTTIVNVALPHVQEGLGLSGGELSWVINAYLLTFGGFLLLGARSGDLLGFSLLASKTKGAYLAEPGLDRIAAVLADCGCR